MDRVNDEDFRKIQKNSEMSTRLTFQISSELFRKLKKIAEEEERSISSIIRQAVKEFLRRRENAENQI